MLFVKFLGCQWICGLGPCEGCRAQPSFVGDICPVSVLCTAEIYICTAVSTLALPGGRYPWGTSKGSSQLLSGDCSVFWNTDVETVGGGRGQQGLSPGSVCTGVFSERRGLFQVLFTVRSQSCDLLGLKWMGLSNVAFIIFSIFCVFYFVVTTYWYY